MTYETRTNSETLMTQIDQTPRLKIELFCLVNPYILNEIIPLFGHLKYLYEDCGGSVVLDSRSKGCRSALCP